jgi:hypothetical protein
VQGLGFTAEGWGLRAEWVQGLRFRAHGSGFWVQGLKLRVWDSGFNNPETLTKTCHVSEFEKKLRLADTQNREKLGDPS